MDNSGKKIQSRFAGLELESNPALSSAATAGAVVRDADHYLAEGLAQELAGNHEKALNNYSAALGQDPLSIEAWARQLWMLLYLEERHEAVVWADRALASFPTDPDILSLKSLALWRNGLTREARHLNDTALAATRSSTNVWLARGEMQVAVDMKSAMACFKHATARTENEGLSLLRAGDILFRARKYGEAVEHYRGATRELSGSSWAWYGYSRAQQALGNKQAASAALDRARNLSPRDRRYREGDKMGWWNRFRNWLSGKK